MKERDNFIEEINKVSAEINDGDHSAFYAMDAGESINPSRSLTSYKPSDIQTLYPELFFANNTLPFQSQASPGAQKYAFYVNDVTGMAKLVSNYSNDAPNVSVTGEEVLVNIFGLQAGIKYSDQDIQADNMSNRGLIQKKQRNLNDSFLRTLDSVICLGDDSVNLKGFVNAENVTEYTIPNGAGGNTEWSTKTADEIITDISNFYETMVDVSRGVHEMNFIVMAPSQFALIQGKRIPDETTTVKEYIEKIYPELTISKSARLKEAGAGNTDVLLGMQSNPDNFAVEISQPYKTYPVDGNGPLFTQQATMRTAGLVVYRPLSIIRSVGV